MNQTKANLFSEIKKYQKISTDIQARLLEDPFEWPQHQDKFNNMVGKITSDIVRFEKENIKKDEAKVYKLKNIFEKRYRKYFLYGEYPKWVYDKPRGYAGDYKIMDDIYQNSPRTKGFDRLWDNYFLQMTASRAARERKEIIKKNLIDIAKKHQGRELNIMNLASGPAREIKELLDLYPEFFSNIFIDCYDFDSYAINYASKLLERTKSVNFMKKNAIRLALTKNIKREIPKDYDVIYSIGLLDYLDKNIAVKLITNLKNALKKNGVIICANFGDKYRNSSAGLMEWATEWFLIYRNQDDLSDIFLRSGFKKEDLCMYSTSDKVIEFCCAKS